MASPSGSPWRRTLAASVALLGVIVPAGPDARLQTPAAAGSITDVAGITIGQGAIPNHATGCTVILAPPNTVGGVDVRGGAPGTREIDVLAPENSVPFVHAIALSGGSAYGLDTARGVMRFLEEKKIGVPVGGGIVPIVSGAILLDIRVAGRPADGAFAECGYRAAASAGRAVEEGSVGAGTGATVGKFAGGAPMKGGLGTAAFRDAGGLVVGVIIAVNAAGSVFDRRTGQPVAGVRRANGQGLEDPFALFRAAGAGDGREMENTTLGVVATNARLTKAQAKRVSIMAHDGLARAIFPSHTPADGDTIFVLATGELTTEPNVGRIGSLAAEAVSDAILRAVRMAKGLPGYPAVSDIKR